jgi:hypothetical protein
MTLYPSPVDIKFTSFTDENLKKNKNKNKKSTQTYTKSLLEKRGGNNVLIKNICQNYIADENGNELFHH